MTKNLVLEKGVNIEINYNDSFYISYNIPDGLLDNKYDLLLVQKLDNIVFDTIKTQDGYYTKGCIKYHFPLSLSIVAKINGETCIVYNEDFNAYGKNVLIRLYPRSREEYDIWFEYLKVFRKKLNCNIFISCDVYPHDGSEFFVGSSEFYATYDICWSSDLNINPFGSDVNPFDLINNALLRL